jgi:DNA-directed RNA polymerase subunit M/transcription elongation factor TFIIS
VSLFEKRYCSKHSITYYGFRCPQCLEDDKDRDREIALEPIKRAEQKREAQKQLPIIMAKLEKATLVKETADYKLLVCPLCGRKSLFYYKTQKAYECFNTKKCSLTSTINWLTELSNR